MKTLQEVRDYLAQIPYINNGGCGVAAYAMYQWLKSNNQLDPDFKFVMCYMGCYEDVYMNNLRVIREKDGNAIACSHIAIWNCDKVIDCDNEINLPRYSYVQFVQEEWFILNALNNIDTWNFRFDREHITTIEKKLKINLSQINKS